MRSINCFTTQAQPRVRDRRIANRDRRWRTIVRDDIVEMAEGRDGERQLYIYLLHLYLRVSISVYSADRRSPRVNVQVNKKKKKKKIKNHASTTSSSRAASFDANAALRGRTNTSCSLASLARPFASFICTYIIERADFQGLPRASDIPSRAKWPHSRARARHYSQQRE